jgi:hypothetical protein
MNKLRLTRILFCSKFPLMKKVRINDPIKFDVLFNQWKRSKNFGSI